MDNEFLRPRLIGKRFSEHTLPLDILKDFAVLGEMLVEVAKRRYFDDNPSRRRLPNGFTKGLELHLLAMEQGSTVAVLSSPPYTLFPFGEQDYLSRAKNEMIDAIAAVSDGGHPELEPELLRYFDRFGRSLRDDEAIEFKDSKQKTITLTPTTRKRLIEASQATSWTDEMILKGRIPMVDQSSLYFDLELNDGCKLKAPFTETHRKNILKYSVGYQENVYVAIKGVVVCGPGNKLKEIESIEYINQLDPLDIEMRLDELAKLQSGWLNGKGFALDGAALSLLAESFEEFFDPELPLPYLYPTAEGGVQAEWTIDNWEVSLEIQLPTLQAELHALNLVTSAEKEFSGSLIADAEHSGWAELNKNLLQLQGDKK